MITSDNDTRNNFHNPASVHKIKILFTTYLKVLPSVVVACVATSMNLVGAVQMTPGSLEPSWAHAGSK